MKYRSSLFTILLFILCSTLFAQTGGKIVGTVVDKDTREPLIGANVLVEGTTLGAATDLDGTFIILRVPPGKYDLRVVYIGYQELIMQNVEVLTALTTALDFELSQEAIVGEQVIVVAETPVIRKDLTSVEARVQAEQIDRMPVQELNDVLSLQAGITRDQDGEIHIRGGRSTEISYMVNGISITDDFTRTQSFQIENESIQELQVVAGTFNAEYGNAMSGVINVVTKTGGSQFRGDLEVWAGDYLSDRDDVFFNIDDFNFSHNYNFQGSLSGPIFQNRLSFFLTGRRWYNDGWLYGPNAYTPTGDRSSVNGDSSAVSLNFKDRWSIQGSLEWQIITPLKLRIDGLGSIEERRNYDHAWRWNPTGDRGDLERGGSVISKLTHQLGKVTFHEVTVAAKYSELESKLYEDPFDPHYVHPDSSNIGSNQFVKGGTDLDWFERYTRSWIAKWDLTSQVTQRHQVKTGVEFQFDDVFYNDITLVPAEDSTGLQIVPFQPEIRDISSPSHNEFTREPFKFAAYIQDKIEYETIIINAGVRFDLFDANGKIPVDPEDPNIYNPFKLINIYKDLDGDGKISADEQRPDNIYTLEEREQFWWKETSVKTQVSPRLGVAYPITETGVIHFSYGIFQQVPNYERLYIDDQLKATTGTGRQGPFGNPDLKPQRTTMYELGLQQEIIKDLAIDVTGFYRDIRDWISVTQPIPTAIAGVSYQIHNNRDLANAKGITFVLKRRYANNFSFNIDYTFMVVDGTNSDDDEEFFSQQDGAEPTKILTPLDWDQRHSLVANLFVGSQTWGTSLITRFDSGQPYTPDFVAGTRTGQSILSGLPKNSRSKPNLFTVDLQAYKNFKFKDFSLQLFAKVFNLLDAKNPTQVFGDTGRADFTFNQIQALQADETWFVQADYYSEPRRIQIGTKISFR